MQETTQEQTHEHEYWMVTDVSEQLGVSESTLKNWERQFRIQVPRNIAGQRRYDPQLLDVFSTIKRLRDEEKGYSTITRILGPVAPVPPPPAESLSAMSAVNASDAVDLTLIDAIEDRVVRAIAAHSDLAEKYARASHYIGTLEERSKHLEERLREAQRLLPARDEIDALRMALVARDAELAQVRAERNAQIGVVHEVAQLMNRLAAQEQELEAFRATFGNRQRGLLGWLKG